MINVKLISYARNNGDHMVTVSGPSAEEIVVSGPPWIQHFYELNPYPLEIEPRETGVFELVP